MAIDNLTQGRTQPPRHVRRHRRYLEPDTDTDDDEHSPRQSARPARSSRTTQSYREHSDSSLSDEAESSVSSTTPAPESSRDPLRRTSTARHQTLAHKRTRREKSNSNHTDFSTYKRKKFAHPLALHSKIDGDSSRINFPVHKQSPPWQILEYQIWFKILQYAACPIYDYAGRCNGAVAWLLEISRLCRSIREASVAVLTWAPPLHPPHRAHGLLNLLSQDQRTLSLNYATKIHALDIEVKQLLIRKSGIDIRSLIDKTPLLKHLRVFHLHDDFMGKFIWAKPVFGRDKWAYGDLFDLLEQNDIRLQSFEWNGRFRDTCESMLLSSTRPCMSTIQNLRLINFFLEDRDEARQHSVRDSSLDAVTTCAYLQRLELVHCNIVDADFMLRLPTNLSDLIIADCQNLTSDALQDYLSDAGRSLVKLHLIGNQVMDLGFTSNLRESCPNLRDLLIDLTYEDSSSYCDRDPLYDHLLPQGRPTWPKNLQSLVIGPLRSLSVTDAEDFYQSLIDAAEEMLFLRNLSIKTLLKDASWRDRAQLRSKWAAILTYVFLVNSLNQQPLKFEQEEISTDGAIDSTRKSSRIQSLENLRVSESVRKVQTGLDIPFDTLPRQNRCERVQFELSDQRPAQEQYREEDFLDEELSGDEEWNGG